MVMRNLFLLIDQDGPYFSTPKKLVQVTKTMFIDPDGRLIVLDVTFKSVKSFRLVAVYVPSGSGQTNFFRDLDNFLGT